MPVYLSLLGILLVLMVSCKTLDTNEDSALSANATEEQDLFVCSGNFSNEHEAIFTQVYHPTDKQKNRIFMADDTVALVRDALAAVPPALLAHYFSFSEAKISMIAKLPEYYAAHKDYLDKNALVLFNQQGEPAAYLKGAISNLGFGSVPEIYVNISDEGRAGLKQEVPDLSIIKQDISMLVSALSVYWAFSASTTSPVKHGGGASLEFSVSSDLAHAKRSLAFILMQEVRFKSAKSDIMNDAMKDTIEIPELTTPIEDWEAYSNSPQWAADWDLYVKNYNEGKGRVFYNWASANFLEAHLCNRVAHLAFAKESQDQDPDYSAQFPLTSKFFNEHIREGLLAGMQESVAHFLLAKQDNSQSKGLGLTSEEENEAPLVVESADDKIVQDVITPDVAFATPEGLALNHGPVFPNLRRAVGYTFQGVANFAVNVASAGVTTGIVAGEVLGTGAQALGQGAVNAAVGTYGLIRMGVIKIVNFVGAVAHRAWNRPLPRMIRYRMQTRRFPILRSLLGR